jgi:hypothetical protein
MSAPGAIGLSAVTLALGAVLAYQWFAPVPPIAVAQAKTVVRAEAPPALPRYDPPSEDQFASINARSAFDPERAPVAEPPEEGTASVTPPDISLVGVAIGGEKSVALLKSPGAMEGISATLGQVVDGWSLVRIAPGFVVFHANGTDYTVKLRAAAGLPQPVLAPATAVPAAH